MSNWRTIAIFAALALLQLAVPLYMVWHWEDVLKNGKAYYWTTAPVDPYDLLRGRYIDLQFQAQIAPALNGEQLEQKQEAYALLAEHNGRAYITGISGSQPSGQPYVRVYVLWVENSNKVHISLPFKRYYMPEHLAPAAEHAYRQNAGKNAVAKVRIKDGYGAIEEVYIGDKTIYEYLEMTAGREKTP